MGKHAFALRDGTEVPSVTTILSNLGWKSYGLMYWAHALGKAGKDLREEREAVAEVGTICHAYAAADIGGRQRGPFDAPDEILEKAERSFASYLQWKAMTRLELLAPELPLVSERHRFGGRLDAVVSFDGSAGLLDFKSSKTLYPDHIVQVAAYAHLWDEHKPEMPLGHWHILRWAPDGAFSHHALSPRQIELGWKAFLDCMSLHQIKKELK